MHIIEPKKINEYETLPFYDFGNNRLTITDGHSGAYVAYGYGIKDIYVNMDHDDICELGQKPYKVDIEWCSRFSINTVADLSNRIVSDEEYQKLWIRRCERMHNLVTSSDVEKIHKAKDEVKGMFLYGSNANLSIFYFEDKHDVLYKLCNGQIEYEC